MLPTAFFPLLRESVEKWWLIRVSSPTKLGIAATQSTLRSCACACTPACVSMCVCVHRCHAARRMTSSTSKDCVKHPVYNTVANMRCKEAKCLHHKQFSVIYQSPQVVSWEMKMFILLITNEYVGKHGTADSVVWDGVGWQCEDRSVLCHGDRETNRHRTGGGVPATESEMLATSTSRTATSRGIATTASTARDTTMPTLRHTYIFVDICRYL